MPNLFPSMKFHNDGDDGDDGNDDGNDGKMRCLE